MSKKLKHALITGATGYIGGKLAAHLSNHGWHVSLLVRAESSKTSHPHLSKYDWYEYDGTINSLYSIPVKSNECIIFHLATYSSIENELDSIDLFAESNLMLGMHLLSFMKNKGLSNIIFAETYWQFDKNGNDNPNTLYAATKIAFSNILKYFSKNDINSTCLVLYDVYATEGDTRPKLINYLLQNKTLKKTLELSPGKQIMDYIHIDDVTNAFGIVGKNMLNNNKPAHNRFVVRSMQERTLKEYIEIILLNIDHNYKITWGGIDYPEYQIMLPWLPQKECLPPGWESKIKFSEAMQSISSK